MKILFVSVSKYWQGRVYREYPYGVGILGTITQNAGHDVKIIDMALDNSPINKIVEDYEPDVIGLSFLSPSLNVATKVIDELNQFYKGHIIAGGVHPTLYPIDILEKGVNVVIKGEGEEIIIPLLDALSKQKVGTYEKEKMEHIPSITYKNEEGNIIDHQMITTSVDLNDLPIMNRDLFDLSLYDHHTILTSRGCPYKCKFCCSWAPGGKSGRIMSGERIMKELEWLVEKYGKLDLYWGDEIFFWSHRDRLSFLKQLKEKQLPITFTVQLRADLINAELIQALKEAGCTKLCLGAESGSDDILNMSKKQLHSEQIEEGIKIAAENGLRTKTWWIVGLPGGDRQAQLKALGIIERSRPNEVAVHQFVPLPGSEFWNDSEKYGINLPDKDVFDQLSYYCEADDVKLDYISSNEIREILQEYSTKLLEMGYVPTDEATELSEYVFTSPFQKTTFNI